jgi:protein SFI1
MSNFRPLRASPLLRPGSTRPARDGNPLEDLRASTVSVPELVGLTPQEIEFIDTVIERAPATATTFLTVLKVYNDLLQERGLDPQNEVVYFGKLLKLGTVKGKNWKEKWQIVKKHHGYPANIPPTRPGPPTFIPRSRRPDPEIDTFTLDSNLDETEAAPSTHADSDIDGPQYHATPRPIYRRSQSPTRSVATTFNSLGLDLGVPASLPSPPTFSQKPKRPFGGHRWDAQSSASTDAAPTQISTPPSYGAAVRDPAPDPGLAPFANFKTRYTAKRTEPDVKPAVKPPPEPTKARGTVINEESAWNKVKMLRDEQDADRFREEKLVERCWDVWRQGLEWITVRVLKTMFTKI